MNKIRRNEIQEIITKLQDVVYELEIQKEQIDCLKCEEEEYHDNIPENLQGSQRAYDSEEVMDYLDSALSEIENTIDSLNEVLSNLESSIDN